MNIVQNGKFYNVQKSDRNVRLKFGKITPEHFGIIGTNSNVETLGQSHSHFSIRHKPFLKNLIQTMTFRLR